MPPTRRQFLVGAAAVAAAWATGCSGSTGSSDPARAGTATTLGSTTTRHTAKLSADPFTLGVASGDPLPDRVVLWTRLAPEPLASGNFGMPADKVDVIWQVAADDRFTKVVADGVATADPGAAHSLHVDAQGLDPSTDYHYRFRVGDWTSPVGRTRTSTAPGDRLDRLAFAVANCQWYEMGAYGAYRHMIEEDLDLVIHLGDYIYEYPSASAERPVAPEWMVETLDDYRLRYASYKTDPHLQAAHARFPFMAIWDDHEVANDYSGDPTMLDRRTAAYRAYWENMPVRLAPPDGPEAVLHRSATFGDLARLCLLDQRQYADAPPCGDPAGLTAVDCPERTGEDREYLGVAQQAWFADEVRKGGVTWNLIGNPVRLAGIDMGGLAGGAGMGAGGVDQPSSYYMETWDGYPDARRRFIDSFTAAGVVNPVVITGDYHAAMVNDVHLDPSDVAGTPVVATELLSPPISSMLFDANPRARNAHVQHFLGAHGYLRVAVEPERLTAAFRVLGDVKDPFTPISTESTWRITPGNPRAERVV